MKAQLPFILLAIVASGKLIFGNLPNSQTPLPSISNGTKEHGEPVSHAPYNDREQVPTNLSEISTPPVTETTINPPSTAILPWFNAINLHYAVQMGNLEAVKYRISIGGDNALAFNKDYPRYAPIHGAAATGELAILSYLVEQAEVPVDSRNELGQTPLHYATQTCNPDVIKYLVEEQGADIRAKDTSNGSPFMFAVSSNRIQAISYLLEQGGADLLNETELGGSGNSLLHVAAVEHHVLMLSVLLDRGGGGVPLETKNRKGETPLHLALSSSESPQGNNALKYLVARGADVNTRNGNGDSLLHTAVLREEVEVPLVQYLVESGVESNVRNKDNLTALELTKIGSPVHEYLLKLEKQNNSSEFTTSTTTAATTLEAPNFPEQVPLEYKFLDLKEAILAGNLDAVRYRISVAGDNINSSSWSGGFKPIHWAAAAGNLPILNYLLDEAGADVDSLADGRLTPLHGSVMSKSLDVARYLVERRGANLSATDVSDATVLHHAVFGNYLEPVRYLLELGAVHVDAKDDLGRSPLYLAAWRCRIATATLLVELGGADPNARDLEGNTPLASAVSGIDCDDRHLVPLVKFLVASGADLKTVNDKGQTLLHQARSLRIFKMLVESGLDVNAKDKQGNTPLHCNDTFFR